MALTSDELKKLRRKHKLSQEELGLKIGLSREMVNKMENGSKPITRGTELKILTALGGELSSLNNKTVPFYDNVEAIAGMETPDMLPVTEPTGSIDVGDLLRDSECAIRIYGNSMMPNYPSGCVVGLRMVTDGIVEYGNVYVIETSDKRYLKRLVKGGEKEYICYSDNTMKFTEGPLEGRFYYDPFPISFDKIVRLYRVIGVIKRNENSTIFGNN